MTDAELDAKFADLGGLAPSEALCARTLMRVREDRSRSAWKVRLIAVAGMVAMAAMSLVVVTPPEKGDAASMVERGSGEQAVGVELRVAVRRASGEVSRFVPGERYLAGETLMFRIQSTKPLELQLRRDGELLWSGLVPASGFDVPVGYTLEAGQPAAIFSLEGGDAPVRFPVRAVSP